MLTQLRLIILAIVGIAFLSIGGLALYWRSNAIEAKAEAARVRLERDQAVAANDQNLKTIDAMQEQARLDGRLVSSLIEEVRQLGAAVADVADKQQELKDGNEEVRGFLGTRVPADLRKLRGR